MLPAQHKLDLYHSAPFSVTVLLHMLALPPAQESQSAEYAAGKPSTVTLLIPVVDISVHTR
jgi:hypothetical protein